MLAPSERKYHCQIHVGYAFGLPTCMWGYGQCSSGGNDHRRGCKSWLKNAVLSQRAHMLTVAAWSEGFTITPTIQPMSQGHLCRLLLFAAKRCKLWVVFVKCEKKWFGEAMTCKCQYFNYDSLLSIWLLLLMTPSLSRSLSLSLLLSLVLDGCFKAIAFCLAIWALLKNF